jgi:hypothetical protein
MVWLVLGVAWLAATLLLLGMAAAVWRRDRRLAAWRSNAARRRPAVAAHRWLPPTPGG